MPGQLGLPEFLGGHADENEEKGGGDDPDEDETCDGNYKSLEVWHVKDTVVHEQDAEFCPSHVPYINNLADEKVLLDDGDIGGADGRGMVAGTPGVHGESDSDNDPVPDLIVHGHVSFPLTAKFLMNKRTARGRTAQPGDRANNVP